MPHTELNTELEYFEKNRSKLVTDHEDKFALIKGENLLGTFDTAENAYAEGVRVYGVKAFLIKEILREDRVEQLPSYYLGLLSV